MEKLIIDIRDNCVGVCTEEEKTIPPAMNTPAECVTYVQDYTDYVMQQMSQWSVEWKTKFTRWIKRALQLLIETPLQRNESCAIPLLSIYLPRRHGKTLFLELLATWIRVLYHARVMISITTSQRPAVHSNKAVGDHCMECGIPKDCSIFTHQLPFHLPPVPFLCVDDYAFVLEGQSVKDFFIQLQNQQKLPSLLVLTSSLQSPDLEHKDYITCDTAQLQLSWWNPKEQVFLATESIL